MNRNIYALLIGIDAYEPPVRPLRGCVNDIRHINALLAAHATAAGDRFYLKVLTDAAATRQAIIDGFRQHLCQVKADDVALFYYSGHGSQQKSPPEFWHLEPDRLDETLVCHDSRRPNSWDLADKELAHVIAEVAERQAHVVVILDCCHSGSGTRNADETGIRRVPTDDRERPLSTFLAGLKVPTTRSAEAERESGWIELPQGRHILLTACRADEEAKEYSLGGKPRGVFSHFLGETLAQFGGAITYRELFKRVNALVRSHAALQSPQIEPTDPAMFEESFLGGAGKVRGQYFTLSRSADAHWVVDGGSVHGIPQPAGEEAAVFAIFPQTSGPAQWRDMKAALGTARARRVEPQRSVVEVRFTAGAPDKSQVFQAVLAALPLPLFGVEFAGEDAGLAPVRAALANAGATGGASLLVRESRREDAELRLAALADHGGRFRITRPADGWRLVADVEGFTDESARKVVARLEHIARWMRIAELRSPPSALTGKVTVDIFTATGDAERDTQPVAESSLHLVYTKDAGGKWRRPRFKIKIINRSDRAVHCALLGLTETFAVQAGLLAGGSVRLESGEEAWANSGKPIATEVPDALWKAGVIELRDVLKLIASTEEVDATLLEQGELDHPALTAAKRSLGVGRTSTLGRLMTRVRSRAFSTEPEDDEIIADWTTQEFTFTTVRPLDSAELSRVAVAELYPGVRVLSHPRLVARARLTAAPIASRDVASGFVLPPLLHDDPAVCQPFLLSSSRSGAPGLSVLELHDVRNQQSVTPAQPLLLEIAQPLAPGEHLLPVTHDGDFFLPIGRSAARDGGVEVVLNALPGPQNTRSLTGAVRIFFQKVISQYFGTQYKYPLLAVWEPGAKEARMIEDPAEVKAKVAQARRIALYIHGIIGEARGMAESALGLAGLPTIPGVRARYDLILTFDYENLNTTIEGNARGLKQRLADAGLVRGHGKTLHIIAHSMGGLVSRWFIEREGGHEIVQHLVMLGTPNGGSPWSTIEEWAVTALSLGLNGLAPIPWVGKILGGLVAAVERIDVSLGQMKPSSELLLLLHESPDPRILYSIIAGNTSLIAPAHPEKEKTCRSLLQRLRSLNLLHVATAAAFFGEANDIAVSVANICRQPPNRARPATVREVACDHLSYFSTTAGLRALDEALPRIN